MVMSTELSRQMSKDENSSKSMILGLLKIVSVCVLVVIDNKLSQIQKDISKDIRIL
jgi:hypothetical protein